jgi:hypothetical protein
MGAGDAPFLYDPPSRRQIAYPYSDFDPKAVTRASWISAAESNVSKPKQEGPLVDFNRHPDSYMIVPPQIVREPMPANTKTKVKAVRWVQFGFRLAQLLGAIGCLLCVIFVKNTEKAQGWIMRIPPAWDMCITAYGVYHLARPAKSRTPASSASYHIFGMLMDSGLIPFYVYTAWFAHQNWVAMPDNEARWKNIFNDNTTSTDPLLFATFIIPVVVGGLHLISLGLGIYLTIIFRKIAKMPPDMNPLEDNLTSRKHQYKNSDASAVSMMQKPGHMSGSTLSVHSQRFSKGAADRTVDFRHSRMNSDMDYSPHNPQSARLSRQAQEQELCHSLVQSRPGSRAGSRNSFAPAPGSHPPLPEKRDCDSFSFVGSLATAPVPPPHTNLDRSHSPRPGSSVSVRDSPAQQAQYAHAPTHAHMQSQQKESLLQDNWFTYDDPDMARDGDLGAPAPPARRRTPNFSRPSPVGSPEPDRGARFSPEPDRAARFSPLLSPQTAARFMPEPLRMNPPTPTEEDPPLLNIMHHGTRHDSFQEPIQPPQHAHQEKFPNHEIHDHHNDHHNHHNDNHHHNDNDHDDDDTSTINANSPNPNQNTTAVPNRSHTTASAQSTQSANTFAASSVYSESAPSLRTANHLHQQSIPDFQSDNLHVHSVGTPRGKQYGDLAAAMRGVRQHEGSQQSPSRYGQQAHQHDLPPSPPKHQVHAQFGGGVGGGAGGRVISRSGADITDESLFVAEHGNGSRRRYVSGKVAEEGMAGGRW